MKIYKKQVLASNSLALLAVLCMLSPATSAQTPAKAAPLSLKTLTQSRLGAFTQQGTLVGIIESSTDPYRTSSFYLLLVAGTKYVGVPLVNGRDNLNSYYTPEPYSVNFWVTPNVYQSDYFETYDCTGTPIIDERGDGAIRLGALPGIGYVDSIGQTRIAYSTSVTTQVFTVNSAKIYGYGCTTQTQPLLGYRFSGSIPFPSQITGRRIP